METFTSTETFYVEHCCKCGIAFGLTEKFERRRRDDGGWFYCPAGHPQHYTESRVKRLERELEAERRMKKRARFERDHAQGSARAYKGHLTRVKNRVSNGVCPCCNRSFEDLARHMATKHPEYAEQEASS